MNYEDRTSLLQAGHLPPKLLIERRESGPVACLRLSGSIDEQFDGPGLARTVRARWLVLDLGGVDRISSFGIRQWVDFIGGVAGRVEAIYFVEVSPKMVDQFNMVANFGGPGHIASFFAPYRCDSCDHDRRRLLRTDEETPLWRAGQAPAFACPSCGTQEYFDEDPATYFSYVAQQAPAPLPPEVAAFLRAELSYGQGGQRKLKIEKRVDGRTTYVRLSGDLDSDLRAQKLAEGLEGEVVFDLGGVLSIDPVGTAQWRKLLQLLDAKSGGGEQVDRVHILAAPAVFLERLGRPEDLTRKGQVLSVLVPYTCPRCRATTQRLVDFGLHGSELRAGRVPRTQCGNCGGPATCVASESWLARLAALPQPQVGDTLRQSIGRLQAAPASRPSSPFMTGSPAQAPPGAYGGRPWPGEPPREQPQKERAQDTRPLRTVRFQWLQARLREIQQVPGLIPGLLVVLLALSGAIVYRILSPPDGRRSAGGWQVVERSLPQTPAWAAPDASRPGDLVFVGQSPPVPDRQKALEQAERAALVQLAQHLGEVLGRQDAAWRDAVRPLYAGALEAPRRGQARLQAPEAERRIALLLRLAPGGGARPELYWEKLARGERQTQELAYQATARLELGPGAFGRLKEHFGRATSCHKATFFPYFPLLGWRFDLPGGVVVARVDSQSRLAAIGLQPQDLVVSVQGRDVEDTAELCRRLEQAAGNGDTTVRVQRGERLLDLSSKRRLPRR